jgi:hypothetical protein
MTEKKLRRFEVWLDDEGQETIEMLHKLGASSAGALRAGLKLLRSALDNPVALRAIFAVPGNTGEYRGIPDTEGSI